MNGNIPESRSGPTVENSRVSSHGRVIFIVCILSYAHLVESIAAAFDVLII